MDTRSWQLLSLTQKIAVLLPKCMEMIDTGLKEMLDTDQFNVIMLIGADGHTQYVANRIDRAEARKTMEMLYQRWGIGLKDYEHVDPNAVEISRQADFLINKYRESVDTQDEIHNLHNLMRYISDLETEVALHRQTSVSSMQTVPDKSKGPAR